LRGSLGATRGSNHQSENHPSVFAPAPRNQATTVGLVALQLPMQKSGKAHDALGGDPMVAASASAIAGVVQATMLLPLNTIQTQMQTGGVSAGEALVSNFERGALSGIRSLYNALGPTVLMLGLRQGLKFGSGAAFKQHLPLHWPEAGRDIVAGGSSALASTVVLFPLDTLKTRWQTGMPAPALHQLYYGFSPAAAHSKYSRLEPGSKSCLDHYCIALTDHARAYRAGAFGMALWVVVRNALERTFPEPSRRNSFKGYSKNFLCGGLAGIAVQLPTFPLDTLKKRLQANQKSQATFAEAKVLLAQGGVARFYRGFWLKCGFVALNGALFNTIFVATRRLLGIDG
jgi:hypothetical protein